MEDEPEIKWFLTHQEPVRGKPLLSDVVEYLKWRDAAFEKMRLSIQLPSEILSPIDSNYSGPIGNGNQMSDSPEKRDSEQESGQYAPVDWKGKSYRCPNCLQIAPYENWEHCVIDGEPYCGGCNVTVFNFLVPDESRFRHEWINDPNDHGMGMNHVQATVDDLRTARELVEQLRRNHAGVRYALDSRDDPNTVHAGIFHELLTIATVLYAQNNGLIKKITQRYQSRPFIIESQPNAHHHS